MSMIRNMPLRARSDRMTESTAGCGLPCPPKLAIAIGNWLAPTPLTSMRIWRAAASAAKDAARTAKR